MKSTNCPLCQGDSSLKYRYRDCDYYQCSNCKSLFVGSAYRPNREEERARYLLHQNDVNDQGYQSFVSPISQSVLADFTPSDTGLDFGSGTGPVIAKILSAHNFNIVTYDPFFDNRPELLNAQYNYIVCCEVMEHFFDPYKEFSLLRKLLKPEGKLYCMTSLYNDQLEFKGWKYKDDSTHVFFYHRKALEWICSKLGFKSVSIHEKLIIFST